MFCLLVFSGLVFLSSGFEHSKLNPGSEKGFKNAQNFLERNLSFICHTLPPITGIPFKISWADGQPVSARTLPEVESSLFSKEFIPV